MDFDEASYEDLDQHAMELLILGTDVLSPVLRGHIFIERILETLVSRKIAKPKALFYKNRSFELKLDLARALGLIDESFYSCFKALNAIRNSYAHKNQYSVSFGELNSLKIDWTKMQERAYKKACEKGEDEAARIALLFLSWQAIHLVKSPLEPSC